MDHVVIDVTRLFYRLFKKKQLTGIDCVMLAYIGNYSGRYHALLSIGGICFLASKETSSDLNHFLQSYQALTFFSFLKIIYYLSRIIIETFIYKNTCAKYVFNLGHNGVTDRYLKQLKALNLDLISMIHDLIPLTNPEYCRLNTHRKYQKLFNNILKNSKGVITTSYFNMQNVVLYSNAVGIQLESTYVRHLPLLKSFHSTETIRPIEETYFVVLGTIEPRKNHLLLLKVWKKLIERCGSKVPILVIIGQRGWNNEEVFRMLERDPAIKKYIIELNNCFDSELIGWLKFSNAMLFPSFTEGYGLPLIEALSNKIPVIASNLSVFKEISNGVPEFIDPYDEELWIKTIQEYLAPNSLPRLAQINRMHLFDVANKSEYFSDLDRWVESIPS